MNSYTIQRNRFRMETEDVSAFRRIAEEVSNTCSDTHELFRKAYFLEKLAMELPVVLFEDEKIVGSMRFWQNRKSPFRNLGHIIVDYPYILRRGIVGIRYDIEANKSMESSAFLQAINAFEILIHRYADAARQKGMHDVADNCMAICNGAPTSFHQALQLIWFVHVFLHAEGMEAGVSFGRFDVYLYPFYHNDIVNGRLTRAEAKILLEHFWLKTNEGDESQNLIVGGDTENELSLLCIEITGMLCLPQPSLSVRYGTATTEQFRNAVNSLIRSGIGMPSIFNDSTVIHALTILGISEEDACDYGIVGCYEANPGNALGLTVAGQFRLHDALLAFLRENTEFEGDFETFYRTFSLYLPEYYRSNVLPNLITRWKGIETHFSSPFESACIESCVRNGICAEHGGAKYTMFGVNILGIGTLVDSFLVIKKLVFEQSIIPLNAFIEQVLNNFPDRTLAEQCRTLSGKYGTDCAESNTFAAELSTLIADMVIENPVADHVVTYPGLFIFYGDINAKSYPATPDGRLCGERISYGIASSDLCQGTSPTSILRSAAHIANNRCACGNPLLLFLPAAEDEILNGLISAYFDNGGFHLHINLADADTMREAQIKPDKYSNLIVRTSGYSAHFKTLSTVLQNALIERAEH